MSRRYRRALLVLLAIAVILASCTTAEAKKRGGRRRRPSSRLPSLFGGRSPRTRNRHNNMEQDESKGVYYYSLPPTTSKPARIILGDELDFSSMGITPNNNKNLRSAKKPKSLRASPSTHHNSLSALEHEYGYYDDIDRPVPHPPLPFPNDGPHLHHHHHHNHRGPAKLPRRLKSRRRPRGRGPGYRLEGHNWHDHYVLEHEFRPQRPKQSLSVTPYLVNAGKNLAGAYRAALLSSAKVALFTGHTASKYIKGVRNLMGHTHRSDTPTQEEALQTSPSDDHSLVLKEEEQPPISSSSSSSSSEQNPPEVVEIDLTNMNSDGGDEGEPNALPKVYLDWGGSFWRMFYNKRNEIPTEKKLV